MTELCCDALTRALDDPQLPLTREAETGEVWVRLLHGTTSGLRLAYCPWCGTPLPPARGDHPTPGTRRTDLDPYQRNIPWDHRPQPWRDEVAELGAAPVELNTTNTHLEQLKQLSSSTSPGQWRTCLAGRDQHTHPSRIEVWDETTLVERYEVELESGPAYAALWDLIAESVTALPVLIDQLQQLRSEPEL